jgi:hypothetical protein
VVYALAPSPLDITRLWAGSDDGLIHVTMNAGVTCVIPGAKKTQQVDDNGRASDLPRLCRLVGAAE